MVTFFTWIGVIGSLAVLWFFLPRLTLVVLAGVFLWETPPLQILIYGPDKNLLSFHFDMTVVMLVFLGFLGFSWDIGKLRDGSFFP